MCFEAGGEGGSAGRSLWRGVVSWRRTGWASGLWPCVLVNVCYYSAVGCGWRLITLLALALALEVAVGAVLVVVVLALVARGGVVEQHAARAVARGAEDLPDEGGLAVAASQRGRRHRGWRVHAARNPTRPV